MSDTGTDGNATSDRRRDARARLIAAPVILLVACGVLWLHDATGLSYGTHLVVALLVAAAGAEMAILLRRSGRPANPREAAILGGLLGLSGLGWELWPNPYSVLAVQPLLLLAAVVYLLIAHLRDTRPEALDAITFRLLPLVYVGFPLSFLAVHAQYARGLAYLVLVAKASDMAGWLIGVPFGRHKMIPSVSPGKSWEGTLAGLAASVLVAVFLSDPLDVYAARSWLYCAAFGLLVGAASILAGITWSGWKRRMGAKDSSALLPAMGGVMDMMDSFLLAAPIASLWQWWPPWHVVI